MALAERAQLVAELSMDDRLRLGAQRAKDEIGNLGDSARLQAGRINDAFGNAGDRIRSQFAGIGADIRKGIGVGIGFGTAQIAADAARQIKDAIGDSISNASALNETLSKSEVIFGGASKAAEAFGGTAARNIGLSKQAAVEAEATFGNLFKTAGIADDQLLGMSQSVVQLAGDIASFNNISVDEALLKLRSGLVGEAEPLRTVGVLLTEANVAAKAVSIGLAENTAHVSEAAKVQARYALILEQTGTAQGDYARTSSGLANASRSLNAELENLSTDLGGVVTPVIRDFTVAVRDAIPAMKEAAPVAEAFFNIVKLGSTLGGTDLIIENIAKQLENQTHIQREAGETAKDYIARVKELQAAFFSLTDSTDESARATAEAAQRWSEGRDRQAELAEAARQTSAFFRQFTTDEGETGAGLDNIANRAQAAALGFDTSTGAVKSLNTALDDLPKDISINIDVGLTGAGAGAFARGFAANGGPAGNTDFTVGPGATGSLTGTTADPAFVASENERRAREARQRAEELARTYNDRVAGAFRNARQIGDTLFDSLHEKALRQIRATETLAQKEHDRATQAAADQLALALKQAEGPVTEAERAQAAIETGRRRRDLFESLAEAQRSGDPRAIRDATEALQSFTAEQKIANLREQAAIVEQKARDEAAKQQAEADAKLAEATRQAILDTAAENKADRQRRAQFEQALIALQKSDKGKSIADIDKDITALEAKFGITTDAAGFHHIATDISEAIKNIKPPAPVVNLRPEFNLRVTLDSRDIRSALAVTANPSQAGSVRAGQATGSRR